MPRTLAVVLTVTAFVWLAMVLGAPLAISRNRAPVIAVMAYQAGSLVCHQRPERSLRIASVQMPVCARCVGLYAAGAAGALVAWVRRRRPVSLSGARARLLLGTAAVPILLSLVLEWSGTIDTSNVARTVTGLPLGLASGWIFVGGLIAERDRDRSRRRDAL